jgi:mannosyltransferase
VCLRQHQLFVGSGIMYEDNEIEELAPWLLILITLIGGILRVFLLTNKGLELEEIFSMWLANHDVADMLQWIAKIDHHPPLYYLLLHYWIKLNGVNASDLRMLSVLFGTGTIPIIFLIGKRISGVLMGLAAAVILALSPFNIRFAQEARMYTLLMFNAAVAIYALVWLLTDERSTQPVGNQLREYFRAWRTFGLAAPGADKSFSYRDTSHDQTGWRGWISRHQWLPLETVETDLAWVTFIVFSAATMLSHNTAVLFPLATNIFVLGLILFQKLKKTGSPPSLQAPALGNWIKAQIGIFLLWSPWMVAFIRQAGRVYQEFWIQQPSWVSVVRTIGSFLNEVTLTQSSLMVVWILYAVVLCIGLVYFRKKFTQFSFLAVLFAIPFVGELIVSIRRPIFLDRTLIWTAIPLFLILAAGIVQLKFRLLMLVVLSVFGLNNLFSASDYYRYLQKEDWSYPASFVAKWVKNEDLLLFNAPWAQLPFDYYFKAYEEKYFIDVEKHGVPSDLFDSGVLVPEMTENDVPRLISLLSGHKSVWLITSLNSNNDTTGLIPQTLASQMQFIYQRDFNGVQVQIYASP